MWADILAFRREPGPVLERVRQRLLAEACTEADDLREGERVAATLVHLGRKRENLAYVKRELERLHMERRALLAQ